MTATPTPTADPAQANPEEVDALAGDDVLAPQRRTGGTRVRGRAARVVDAVLRATGEELCLVGYAALRIEDIAARSGVNKSTIYRRWPSKADLVRAAITELTEHTVAIDTGSVREDLRESLLRLSRLHEIPKWRGIMSTIANRSDPDVDELADQLRDQQHAMRVAMIERGIARGELPAAINAELVADLVTGPVFRRMFNFMENVDAGYIDQVLDIVFAGLNRQPD
jgi:AcrR family transcriptional regulator